MQKLKQKQNIDFIKYTLFFFCFVVLYNFLIVNKCHLWSVDNITYTYYLVDYSFGFTTKMLPGAIYHLFFKEVYTKQLNICLTILMLLFFAFVAFSLAKIMVSRREAASRNTLFVLALFFLAGPCTFAVFIDKLGMLDAYWLLFSALFLICVSNRYLKYAIPLVFVLTILVHFSSVLCYIVFYSILLLYRLVHIEQKKEKVGIGIVFAVSIVLVLALGAYFIVEEKNNLVYNLQDFNKQLDARYHYDNHPYYLYYDYSLYKHYDLENASYAQILKTPLIQSTNLFARVINTVYHQLKIVYAMYENCPRVLAQLAFMLLLISPIYCIITAYWIRKIKSTQKYKKWIFILCILQFPFTAGVGLCFSPDVSRWLSHAFLIQFTLFLYVIYDQKDELTVQLTATSFVQKVMIVLYYAMYAMTYVNPYQ